VKPTPSGRYWPSIICLAVTLVVGCGVREPRASNTRSCDDIAALELRSLLRETISPEDMKNHLAAAFQVPVEKIESAQNADGSGYVQVTKNGMAYTVVMQDSHPLSGRLLFDSRPPPVQKAIQCLGNPQWYRAYYAYGPTAVDHTLSLVMYYPAEGIAIWAGTYGHTKEPPPLDQNMPIDFLDFVVPSLDEQATMENLLRDHAPEFREEIKRQLKPWPSDWRDLQVEVDPALR